jgi:hypothetical protein
MRRHTTTLSIVALVSSLLLAACGGGDAYVGGTVSGLPASTSVVLQNNATDTLTVSANGNFTFATALESSSAYSVTVLTHPAGATCTVFNGSGTIDSNGSDVSNVTVTCIASASLTGTVSGLVAGTAVTLSNAGVTLAVAANGGFAFPGLMSAGTTYSVTVTQNPAGQTCSVANGSGTIVTGTLTNVVVTCS